MVYDIPKASLRMLWPRGKMYTTILYNIPYIYGIPKASLRMLLAHVASRVRKKVRQTTLKYIFRSKLSYTSYIKICSSLIFEIL